VPIQGQPVEGLLHLRGQFIEGQLQGIHAQLRKVEQVTLFGGASDLELAQLRMHDLEHLSGVSGSRLNPIGLLTQSSDLLLCRSKLAAERFEPHAIGIEHPESLFDRPRQAFAPPLDVGDPRLRGNYTRLDLSVAFLYPRHIRIDRRCAFDQRSVSRLGLRGAAGQGLLRFARIAEPMLGARELLVGGALRVLQPRDRFARFPLSRLQPLALLFCAAALDLQQLGFPLNFLQVVRRTLQLQLERQDGLLFAVQIGGRRSQRVRCVSNPRLNRRHLRDRVIPFGFPSSHSIAKLLDLALETENRQAFVLAATRHQRAPAHEVAVERCDHRMRLTGRMECLGQIRSDEALWDHCIERRRVRAGHSQHGTDGDEPGGRIDRPVKRRTGDTVVSLGTIQDNKSTAARIGLADQVEASLCLPVGRDNDVLEEVAEARLDGSLVPGIHLEVVGHRSLLLHAAVGLGKDYPCRLRVAGPGLLQIGERCQSRLQPGELPLARVKAGRFPLELDARGSQLGFSSDLREQRRLCGLPGSTQPVGRRHSIAFEALCFRTHIGLFNTQLCELLGDPLPRFFRVLNRMSKGRRDVQGREDLRTRRFDVRLEPLNAVVLRGVRLLNLLQLVGRVLSIPLRRRGRLLPIEKLDPSWLATRVQICELAANLFCPCRQGIGLLAIELDLLLATADVEFAVVDAFARARRCRLRFGNRDADTAEISLRRANRRGRGRFALACVIQAPRSTPSWRLPPGIARRSAASPSAAARRATACSASPWPTGV
jgi:hypothetical protein